MNGGGPQHKAGGHRLQRRKGKQGNVSAEACGEQAGRRFGKTLPQAGIGCKQVELAMFHAQLSVCCVACAVRGKIEAQQRAAMRREHIPEGLQCGTFLISAESVNAKHGKARHF